MIPSVQRVVAKSRHLILSLKHLPTRSRRIALASFIVFALVLLAILSEDSFSRITDARKDSGNREAMADLAALQNEIETLQRRFHALAVERKLLPADSPVAAPVTAVPGDASRPRPSTAGLPWGQIFKPAGDPAPTVPRVVMPPHKANSYDFPAVVPRGGAADPAVGAPRAQGRITAAEIPSYRVNWVDCEKLLAGEGAERARAGAYQREKASAGAIERAAKNCAMFIEGRRYLMRPVSEEEGSLSIAFSIIMHNEVRAAAARV